jgi:hypothetical protein
VIDGSTMKEEKWKRKATTNRCPSPAKSFILDPVRRRRVLLPQTSIHSYTPPPGNWDYAVPGSGDNAVLILTRRRSTTKQMHRFKQEHDQSGRRTTRRGSSSLRVVGNLIDSITNGDTPVFAKSAPCAPKRAEQHCNWSVSACHRAGVLRRRRQGWQREGDSGTVSPVACLYAWCRVVLDRGKCALECTPPYFLSGRLDLGYDLLGWNSW